VERHRYGISEGNLPAGHASAHHLLVRPLPVPGGYWRSERVRCEAVSGVVRSYQPRVPGPPLKGPVTSEVIQPP
jgi:hypothetical protein